MILESTVKLVLDIYKYHKIIPPRVSKVVIGLGYTGVELEALAYGPFLGLAATLPAMIQSTDWQEDNPFTEEQNRENYSLTWLFSSGDQNRLNTDFQSYVKNKEDGIKRRLRLSNVEDAPEDVLDALDRYRKEVYNKILADLRGKQAAPSMAITGSSNYKGNFDKRESIERNAYEKYKKVDNAVDRVVGQYANLKKIRTAEERRQEYREMITPKLIEAKAKGKKAFSYLDNRWYDIIRVNKKSITVRSDFMGDFTIYKHFIKSIEK